MIENPNKTFLVLVSYLAPVEGTLVIPCKDEDEARAKTLELFQNRINVNIVMVSCLDETPTEEPQPQDEPTNIIIFDPEARKSDPNKKKNNNDKDSFPDR